MKKLITLILGILALFHCYGFKSELKTYTLSDGEKVLGRLCIPDSGGFNTLVFVVHGTGTNTYLNMRKSAVEFNYYDELAKEFCKRGVAFFSYNRRGVEVDENNPPLCHRIDSGKFVKYTPLREAEDVENMVSTLRKDKRVKKSKLILYGISEGTIIAPMVADRKNVEVDALFLHGYANENMYDIIVWQNEGHGVMMIANQFMDKDGDEKISREEYMSEDATVAAYRNYLFDDLLFDSMDVDKSQYIDVRDIGTMRLKFHEVLMEEVKNDNNKWIWKNYTEAPTTWFKEHFALEANKSRLLRLNIPIHIFHGTHDANVPVKGVYDIEERFKVVNKSNLKAHVFKKHNHDLNFEQCLFGKSCSKGMKAIYNEAKNFGKP